MVLHKINHSSKQSPLVVCLMQDLNCGHLGGSPINNPPICPLTSSERGLFSLFELLSVWFASLLSPAVTATSYTCTFHVLTSSGSAGLLDALTWDKAARIRVCVSKFGLSPISANTDSKIFVTLKLEREDCCIITQFTNIHFSRDFRFPS